MFLPFGCFAASEQRQCRGVEFAPNQTLSVTEILPDVYHPLLLPSAGQPQTMIETQDLYPTGNMGLRHFKTAFVVDCIQLVSPVISDEKDK